jgi:hypothetical protein
MLFRLLGVLIPAMMLASIIAPAATAGSTSNAPVALPGRTTEVLAGKTVQRLDPILSPDRFALLGDATPTSNIQVTYNGFSQAAHDAFEAAVQVWEARIVSSQVIHVTANWTPLGQGVLGSAGPNAFYLANGIVYPVALYEARCSCESGTSVEITANFNSSFSGWYLETDGNAPGTKYDFFTVVLHEIGHGLGFMSSFGVARIQGVDQGIWGFTAGNNPTVYGLQFDFAEWSAATGGNKLTNTSVYPNPSPALKTELTDNNVYFGGPNAVAVNGGRVRLYSPSTWNGGSSNSHLDDSTFPAGTENALMTHQLANGEVIHDPGPLTLAILRDIGWTTSDGTPSADTTPPTVMAPAARVYAPQQLGANAGLRVEWPAATDESGVASYQLQRMKNNNGTWVTVSLGTPTQTIVDMQLAPGNIYEFRLRATDTEGNTSGWVMSTEAKLRLAQENWAAVTYSGTWKRPTLKGASGGYVRYTGVAGRRATVSFSGRSVAFVSTLAPNRGIAAIWLDGSFVENVDLYAPALTTASVVRAYAGLGPGTHTLQVRVTGTRNPSSTANRVDVDAFVIY